MSNMMWAELQQPVYPVEYNNTINSHKLKYQSKPKAINHPYMQQHPSQTSNNKKEREEQQLQKPSSPKISTKRKSQSSKYIEDDEKRKNFLERNRQAALKCRQRKKQWLNNLQARVEFLSNDNEQLQIQVNLMREEAINLRNLLMAHKDCHLNTVIQPQQQRQQQFRGVIPTAPSNSNYINT